MVKISFELDGELIDVQLSAPCGVDEFIDAALEVLSYMENFDGITEEQLVPGYKDFSKKANESEKARYVFDKLSVRKFAILYRDGETCTGSKALCGFVQSVPDWIYIRYLLAILCEFRTRLDLLSLDQVKSDEYDRVFLQWLFEYCLVVGDVNWHSFIDSFLQDVGEFLNKKLKSPKNIVDMFFRMKIIETTGASGGSFDDSISFNIRTNRHEYRVLMVSSILRIRAIENGHSFDIDILKMDDEDLIEAMLPGLSEFTGCKEVTGNTPAEKLDCILKWVQKHEFYREFHVWNNANSSYDRQNIPRDFNVGYKELAQAEETITSICNGKDIPIFVYLTWAKREYGSSLLDLLLNPCAPGYTYEFEESYKGSYRTLGEFARSAVKCGMLSIPGDSGEVRSRLLDFIDWDKVYTAMLDCSMVMHITCTDEYHVFTKRNRESTAISAGS